MRFGLKEIDERIVISATKEPKENDTQAKGRSE